MGGLARRAAVHLLHLVPRRPQVVFDVGALKVELHEPLVVARLERHHYLVGPRHLNHGHALREHTQLLGSPPRQVYDSASAKGTAVCDPHHHRAAVGRVGYLEHCAEGVGAVGAGKAVVVQAFAAAGARPSGTLGVVGGLAPLHVLRGRGCWRNRHECQCQCYCLMCHNLRFLYNNGVNRSFIASGAVPGGNKAAVNPVVAALAGLLPRLILCPGPSWRWPLS